MVTKSELRQFLKIQLAQHLGKRLVNAGFVDIQHEPDRVLLKPPEVILDANGQPSYRKITSISLDKLTDLLQEGITAGAITRTSRQQIKTWLANDSELGPWIARNL